MTLGLITNVGVVILLLLAVILCVALIVAVVKLLPPLLKTARNLEKVSGDLVAVSGDATRDIANAAHNLNIASENTVEASKNVVAATTDFAETAANVVAISRLDVRAILSQVARGNIGSLKDLASFVAQNVPQATSRVGSLFRRRGG